MPSVLSPDAGPFAKTLFALAQAVPADTPLEKLDEVITRFVNSPLAEMLVKVTPNPFDDALLMLMRRLFPPN
jgi:hypothetical protein